MLFLQHTDMCLSWGGGGGEEVMEEMEGVYVP